MTVSVLVMWLGSVCVTIKSSGPKSIGLIANAIPFGTDQMLGASSEDISAFIHWFVLAMYTGLTSG